MASLTLANISFSVDLFKRIRERNETGNVFYSPLSISSALAMVYLGAKGNTAAQMSEVLFITKVMGSGTAAHPMLQQDQQVQQAPQIQQVQQYQQVQQCQEVQQEPQIQVQGQQVQQAQHIQQCVPFSTDIHVGFSKLICELQRGGAPYSLSLANRLYGEQSFKFVEEFLKDTQKYYGAELDAVDFKSNPEAVRKNINGWVEKQTQAKIKDLLIKGIVCQDTRLVLVNAVYFKGFWENKFVEHNTREIQFKLKKNETKPVQMMFQTGQFPLAFIPEVNIQILELPYKGKDLSMLIMLPNGIADDTTGLEKLERELTHENFVKWTKSHQMNHVVVEVGLPRFRMEETHDLKDLLISMGMVDAFDQHKCDFSGMSPNKDLVLSKVVHKCFVDVNEEGTEAAGAAGATLTERCGTVAPKLFVADHPFLFFIRHNPTQSILFCGRYSSP